MYEPLVLNVIAMLFILLPTLFIEQSGCVLYFADILIFF